MAGIQLSNAELEQFRVPLLKLQESGWLTNIDEGWLRLTPDGVMFSNEVFREFLAD